MKRKAVILVLGMSLLAISGCVFAPWKDRTYDAGEGDFPATHGDAMDALTGWGEKTYESAKIDGMVCSVMMEASGFYLERRDPYAVWLLLARVVDRRKADFVERVRIRRIRVKRDGDILYELGELVLSLDGRERYHGRTLVTGECHLWLSDVLDPCDGKRIQVVIEVVDRSGTVREITMSFLPKVEKGLIRTLG